MAIRAKKKHASFVIVFQVAKYIYVYSCTDTLILLNSFKIEFVTFWWA